MSTILVQPSGVQLLLDDNEILMMIESLGLNKLWTEAKQRANAADADAILFLWRDDEAVLIQEITGVPGDEGLAMHRFPRATFDHPQAVMIRTMIEQDRGLTVASINGVGFHHENRSRN